MLHNCIIWKYEGKHIENSCDSEKPHCGMEGQQSREFGFYYDFWYNLLYLGDCITLFKS